MGETFLISLYLCEPWISSYLSVSLIWACIFFINIIEVLPVVYQIQKLNVLKSLIYKAGFGRKACEI